MQDVLARIFVVFLLMLYTSISLAFIITGIRNWIWRPLKNRLSGHPEKSYHRIKSTSREQSPS